MLPKILFRAVVAVVLSSQAGISQQADIPVKCGHAPDVAVPSPPPPARQTAAGAEAIVKAGRAEAGFLSMDEPVNFSITRYKISEYADCFGTFGCYWTDLAAQTQRAQEELKRLLATSTKPPDELAIVLDIDETSLSSYCEEKREGFGYVDSQYQAWIVSSEASIPIPGTLALFNQARAAKVNVFFITGRPHEQTDATARNLKAAGYKDWQGLVLRSEEERTEDTTKYKAKEREKIAKKYHIIMNVGDQWSDLNGAPKAEISVKLPNPFYFLP